MTNNAAIITVIYDLWHHNNLGKFKKIKWSSFLCLLRSLHFSDPQQRETTYVCYSLVLWWNVSHTRLKEGRVCLDPRLEGAAATVAGCEWLEGVLVKSLVLGLSDWRVCWWKARWCGCERLKGVPVKSTVTWVWAACVLQKQQDAERWMLLRLLLLFMQPRPPPPAWEIVPSTFWVDLHQLINLNLNLPHRHAQRFVPWMISDPVKLTINIHYHWNPKQ